MARSPRTRRMEAERKTPERKQFYILDPNMQSVVLDGREQEVTPQMHEKGIMGTDQEMMFYVANGVVGTENPRKSKAAQAAVAAAEGDVPDFGKDKRGK